MRSGAVLDTGFLITLVDGNRDAHEDTNTMSAYCRLLRDEGKIDFKVIELSKGFDVSFVNGNGQTEMDYSGEE